MNRAVNGHEFDIKEPGEDGHADGDGKLNAAET